MATKKILPKAEQFKQLAQQDTRNVIAKRNKVI